MKKYRNYAMVLSVFGLALLLAGVTYSFFNYTKTGGANNLGTGNISFNATYGNAINITNVFPMTSSEASEANLSTTTVNISGSTDYTSGEEFLVSIVDVNNTVNNKKIPINYIATYEANNGSIGTSTDNYFEATKNANIYKLNSTGRIVEDKQVLVGFIKGGTDGINGTLTISAYVDADRIAITDTPEENSDWINGRTVFSTTEWSSFQGNNAISFKLRTESNQGTWVEEPDPDNVLDSQCFGTKMKSLYYLNDNLNSTQLADCINYHDGYTFDTGTTAETYCLGTGTISGLTLGESSLLGTRDYLFEKGILIEEIGLEINDYDDTCGSDVVIPTKMDYTKLIINPNMTTNQFNTCVSYLSSTYNGFETSDIEDWCNGEVNFLNYTLEDEVNLHSSSTIVTYLKNEGIIIDGPTQQYDVISINYTNFGYAGGQGAYDNSKFLNLTSLVFPKNLKVIGASTVIVADGKTYPQNIVVPQSVIQINALAFMISNTATSGATIPNTTFTILGNPVISDYSLPGYETISYGGTCQELKRGLYSGIYAVYSKGNSSDQSIYVNTTDNNLCEVRDMYD